jgi:hypothetical protein
VLPKFACEKHAHSFYKSMTIHCVAFVGKNNEPLFLSSSILGPLAHDIHASGGGSGGPGAGAADALQLQCIAHSALDIIEEKRGKKWDHAYYIALLSLSFLFGLFPGI